MRKNDTILNAAYKIDYSRHWSKSYNAAEKTRHLGGMYFGIPEYHDEQQFQTGTNEFGPMVYVYASPFIGAFKKKEDFSEQGPGGVFAALIDVDAPLGTALPQPYRQLNLVPGENCLWIALSAAGAWSAYVTPAEDEGKCQRPLTVPTMDVPFVVQRSTNPAFRESDYPPVARFTEARFATGTYGQPLIGIKCLDGWCDIGPGGTVVKATMTSTAMPGRYGQIKGWNDEQILVSQDPLTRALTPSVRSTIVPDFRLERYSVDSFPIMTTAVADQNRGWVPVAIIVLDADPLTTSKYYKWGLRRGDNYLYLRRITPGTGVKDWQASIVRPLSGERFIWQNVIRDPHTDVLVPGTARWRFASFDPTGVWVRCGQACCSADGGDG